MVSKWCRNLSIDSRLPLSVGILEINIPASLRVYPSKLPRRQDYWGDFHQRYWGHAPKQDGLPQVDKAVATKRFLAGVFEQVVRKGNARSS